MRLQSLVYEFENPIGFNDSCFFTSLFGLPISDNTFHYRYDPVPILTTQH